MLLGEFARTYLHLTIPVQVTVFNQSIADKLLILSCTPKPSPYQKGVLHGIHCFYASLCSSVI